MNRSIIERRLERLRKLQDSKQKGTEKELKREFRRLLSELRRVIGEEFSINANEEKLSYTVLRKNGRLEEFWHKVEATILLLSLRVPELLNDTAYTAYYNSWAGLALAVSETVKPKPYKVLATAFATPTAETMAVALAKNPYFKDYKQYSKELSEDLQKSILRDIKKNLATGADLSTLSQTVNDRTQKAFRAAVQASRTTSHTFTEAGLGDAGKGLDEGFKAVKAYSDQAVKQTERATRAAETIGERTAKAIKTGRPLPLLEVPPVEVRAVNRGNKVANFAKTKNIGPAAKAQLTALDIEEVFIKAGEEPDNKNNAQNLPVLQMYKTWRSMRDERVRQTPKANHRKMDGVSIPVKERFDLGHGVTTDVPGNSGDPANDARCRCILIYDLKEG